jgi:hypothetical protein
MKASPLFLLPLFLPLFGSHAPERRDAQSPSRQDRQQQVDRLCPTVTVACADSVRLGSPAKFTAKISGAGPSPSLTLSWTVDAGVISSGQNPTHISEANNTTDISVATNGLHAYSTITATIQVGGLARSCADKNSCTSAIIQPPPLERFDEYGDINLESERARLDNYAIGLQDDPTMNGYIVCYGGRRGRRGEAMARCERAKKYLAGYRRIEAARLILIDGGFREQLTVALWIMPPDVKPPLDPTVNPSEVQFIEGPRKRKGRTARRRRSE